MEAPLTKSDRLNVLFRAGASDLKLSCLQKNIYMRLIGICMEAVKVVLKTFKL